MPIITRMLYAKYDLNRTLQDMEVITLVAMEGITVVAMVI